MQLELLELDNLVNALTKGGTILIPTDTIWGISCDATNQSAVKRIFEIKRREEEKKCIVLVSSFSMLKKYISAIHPRVETLLRFYKKPTTCIYSASKETPPYLVSTDGTIAIRIVNDSFIKELIEKFGRPIVSTSANISGDDIPYTYNDISKELTSLIDYIPVVGEKLRNEEFTTPSVIITFDDQGELEFLRS